VIMTTVKSAFAATCLVALSLTPAFARAGLFDDDEARKAMFRHMDVKVA